MITIKNTDGKYTVKIGDAKPVALVPNKDNYLELPANDLNRKYVSCAKVDAAEKQTLVYDTVKPTRTLGARAERQAPEYSQEDAAKLADIDAKIEKLRDARKAITAKYATKQPTKFDLMVEAIAKKMGQPVEAVRAAALKAKEDAKAGK